MNKNITEQMISSVYLCRDGKMRVLLRSDFLGYRKMAEVKEIQEKLLENEEKFHFFYSLLNNNVVFEKGLLFGEFINCIKPWKKHIGSLFNIDAGSFFEHVNDEARDFINSNDFKIQLIECVLLSNNEKYSKGRSLIKNENGYYSYEAEKDDFKISDKSFSFHSEGMKWSIVNKNKDSKFPRCMSIGNMKGLSDLELDMNSDLFLFSGENKGISFPTTESDYAINISENKSNNLMLRISKGKFSITLFDILKDLFSELDYSFEDSEIKNDLLFIVLSDGKEEINKDLENACEKKRSEETLFIEETKEKINNAKLTIRDFSEDDFNYENSETFVFSDKIYKSKLKEEKL